MSWTDYIFGFGPKEQPVPLTPEETLRNAVIANNTEAVTRMLEEIQSPCGRLDFARKAQGSNNLDERAVVSLSEHLDGTETVAMWRVGEGFRARHRFPLGGNIVASIDQPACKR